MAVQIAPGASIQAAIDANPSGTVFQLSAGVYRGQSFLAKSNDQFLGDPGGGTIISGALQLTQWTQSGAYWKVSGLPAPLAGGGEAGSNPLATAREDLFIDNVVYRRVGSLAQVTSGTWYFDAGTRSAFISVNPTGHSAEYSATPNLTYDNGATGVVVADVTIEKYATNAQGGPIHGVRNWQLNNVTSHWNHGAGVNLGAGTVVNGGHYNDNGQIGIDTWQSHGAKILGAEIARNNYAGYNVDWEAGAMKIAGSDGVVISGNNVHDNYGQGIWADINNTNFTIENNTVTHNDNVGIFYEISYGGTVIRNNTIADNGGSGIYLSNSQGVEVTGNTVTVRSGNTPTSTHAAGNGGIDVINTSRGSGSQGVWESKNLNIHNNSITHPGDTGRDGIYLYQAVSNPNITFNSDTYNVPNNTYTFWHFGNTDYTWDTLHQSTPYEANGTVSVGGAPPPPPPPPPPPVDTATLLLVLAGDAWRGNAQFTAKVDGAQIAGPTQVTASHDAGQSQTFTYTGSWAAGLPHDVQVDFINDLSNPGRDHDRNLYVENVVYKGTSFMTTEAVLATNGAFHVQVQQQMATFTLTLGQSINTALQTTAAAGDTINFAAGIYRCQTWTAKANQRLVGHPSGTILSGASLITTWTNVSANWYTATNGVTDASPAGTAFPTPGCRARFTGSISGTTLTVSSTQSGTVALVGGGDVGIIYGNGVTADTRLVSGAGSTWTVSKSQTIGAGTIFTLLDNYYEPLPNTVNPMAGPGEELWVDNVKYTRIQAAATPVAPGVGQWYFNNQNSTVNINLATPTSHVIELGQVQQASSTGQAGIAGVTVRDITFEKWSNQNGAPVGGDEGGWKYINCNGRYNRACGIDMGTGPCVVSGGSYSDNGKTGIIGRPTSGSCSNVEMARNNVNMFPAGNDTGGMKLTDCTLTVVSNCYAHDNVGPGIWFDIDCANVTIANNICNNQTGTTGANAGIMYEISYGETKIINNSCSNNEGAGIFISNSAGVECYGNKITVGGTSAGGRIAGGISVYSGVRGSGNQGVWEAKNLKIHHNIITIPGTVAASVRDGWQIDQTVTVASNNYWDYNTYYTAASTGTHWGFTTSDTTGNNTDYTWATLQASALRYEKNGSNIVGVASTTVPPEFVGPDVRSTYGPVTLVALDVAVVTTANTAVTALTSGHRALGGWIQNPVGAPANLGINEQGTAAGTTSSGATTFIPPGARYKLTPAAGAVSVISQVSGHAFSGQGWT